jgi:hypothetical protein
MGDGRPLFVGPHLSRPPDILAAGVAVKFDVNDPSLFDWARSRVIAHLDGNEPEVIEVIDFDSGRHVAAPMKVVVVDRVAMGASWGNPGLGRVVTREVAISRRCPVCGGRRGRPVVVPFCEDGEHSSASRWNNPCGHVDKYTAVLEEAALRVAILDALAGTDSEVIEEIRRNHARALSMRDLRAVAGWLGAGLSAGQVELIARLGMCEEEHGGGSALRAFKLIWAWSSRRVGGSAGRHQQALLSRWGEGFVDRRIDRVCGLVLARFGVNLGGARGDIRGVAP